MSQMKKRSITEYAMEEDVKSQAYTRAFKIKSELKGHILRKVCNIMNLQKKSLKTLTVLLK